MEIWLRIQSRSSYYLCIKIQNGNSQSSDFAYLFPSTPLPHGRSYPDTNPSRVLIKGRGNPLVHSLGLSGDRASVGCPSYALTMGPSPSPQVFFRRWDLPSLLHVFYAPHWANCMKNLSRAQLLEWCRDNSVVWENPVRENTTHYTVEYTCKAVLCCKLSRFGVQENLYFRE